MYIKQIRFEGTRQTEYPFHLPFLNNLNEIVFDAPIQVISGRNGSGKSTFLEMLAGLLDLNLEGGSRNNIFETRRTHSALDECCRLIRYPNYPKDSYFYRAESFYNLESELDDLAVSDDIFQRSIHTFSRGEAVKALIRERFFGRGIYLFDEPETGLSLESQLELIVLLNDLAKADSQLFICTHSPLLLMLPHANIYEFTDEGIFLTDTQHSTVIADWEMLLQRKEHFLHQMLDEEA